uniref:Zinc finger ZZ-type and EF-hand domain containing 1 n=1 Tax=Monodelphis domestica TaxID=13616 RepID=A0A5F8H4L4_MONDO
MGNVPSAYSDDDELEGPGEAGAAPGAGPVAAGADAPGLHRSPGPEGSPSAAAAGGLPRAPALLEPGALREAAARLSPGATPSPSPASTSGASGRPQAALLRWLEERRIRGDIVVSVEQLREALEARGAGDEVVGQFEAEGDGTVDVETALEALKSARGASLPGELSHVTRQLQACPLVPGFVDIFAEAREGLGAHCSLILRFLHRHRVASAAIPYPLLDYCHTISALRSLVLKEALERLARRDKEGPGELGGGQEAEQLKSVAKCYAYIETSSNSIDIDKMTNGDTASFWQSDGSARSHWVRLKMKPDVVLRHLSIAVAASDQSYMPQQVTVAVGRSANSLQEVRDVHIPSNVTGYVTLLENANISQLYVQINVKRCLSDGCDTRIRGLRAVGFQRVRRGGVSVSDASAIWYWSLLTSLVTASMETSPAFVQTVLQNTQYVWPPHLPLGPFGGSPHRSGGSLPSLLVSSCSAKPEVELTLLAFALARGSIAKVLSSLCAITDRLDTPYQASGLLSSMAAVRQNLLYKYGRILQPTLQACDVKGKGEKSGPENLLAEPWTGDGFLTETGKTRASVIFSTGTEAAFQVTQLRIKVRRGGIGAQCGLLFAYNSASEKFHAEEHFKRFEKYDTWKLPEFRQFLKSRMGNSSTDLGEDEPAGWFEAEEDWDEVEVKMNCCRVAKYLMVKFLCTRRETAERLGVQGLSVYGYVRPAAAELGTGTACARCEPEADRICGMTLLLRTLSFIQQLAQDLARQKESGLKHKPLLDTAGLHLQLFWSFYSRLESRPREECVLARTLLLQLLQSCLADLTADPPPPAGQGCPPGERPESRRRAQAAPEELYAHLCQVVDQDAADSLPARRLQEEVRNTLLQGAAVFFPDGHARRRHLFAMMKNVTEQEQKPSAHLTFRSLCAYFSGCDPGGLLLLPDKGGSEGLDVQEALAVMDTLQAAAARECDALMLGTAQGESSPALFSLFWSVQGSLLSWCYLQFKGNEPHAKRLAAEVVERYVGQFLASVRRALRSLLSRYSGKEVVERLCNSVFAMATRQLVIFLLDFCTLDLPHLTLLKEFSTLTEPLKSLCGDPDGGGPDRLDMETWQREQPVVLNTWSMESAHNYENNCHEVAVFVSPGATSFEVVFDDKCETETRYDYLEFTDARGVKTRYDTKVGTDKWPKKVTFRAGPRLHFLFHSDSSNNEWGYKFTVTAYGLPDVAISWGLDLQLLVSRLMGRLASQCLSLKPDRKCCPRRGAGALGPSAGSSLGSKPGDPGIAHAVFSWLAAWPGCPSARADACRDVLLDFATAAPAPASGGRSSELVQGLAQACRRQAPQTDRVAGSAVDGAVNATFAALVYLTPPLYEKLQSYVSSGGQLALSEDFAQVYALADGIRIWMLEMKQKFLLDQGDEVEGEPGAEMREVNPENLAKQCVQKSLLLLRFVPKGAGPRGGPRDRLARQDEAAPLQPQGAGQKAACVVEEYFQSPSPGGSISQPEDVASPPSTPTRKPGFSRGRLRLLSFRSMEEARPVATVTEKYPCLKDVMDFIKDQTLSHESVLKVLSLKKAQAQGILDVLKTSQQCLEPLGQPHCFHAACLLFLLELLSCQKDLADYLEHLEGCGAELHTEIRRSYHQLVRFLVDAVKGFEFPGFPRGLSPPLSEVRGGLCSLLLGNGGEPSDLPFLVDIQLPELLMTMSQENISLHDSVICQWSEEDEIADYKQTSEWMDECQDGMFEAWYEKISQMDPEKQRKMHMFIARYCDLLNVDISCDGCDEIAPWHRYRCLQCHDMDLCKTCFLGGVKPEGHEDDHEMVNMEYACDHCQGVIVGRRVNCNVCDDFDLCYGCYSAKKFSDSHLPSHGITVYPMVTIRTSDHQRLIQPYIHNYSWLLFAALTLYTADLAGGGEGEGQRLGAEDHQAAATLRDQCLELIGDCLVKAQRAKGEAQSSALVPTESSEKMDRTGRPAMVPCRVSRAHTSSCVFYSSPSGIRPPVTALASASVGGVTWVLFNAGASSLETVEENVTALSPEQVFAECSQKRILGLLAAMLPPLQSGSTISWANLDHILPLMFQVVISNAGHLNETYHLTLGLLGQLVVRLQPAKVDAAVSEALSAKHTLLSAGDGSASPEGWKTVHLLFSLGAVCLDSRVGLDWACSMADILRALHACPQWHSVVAAFTDHCMKQLPFQLKHTNIFTLLVLVGFPEVLCMGARSVYLDNANEPHDVIVLKHFTEKSRVVVVDVKTRKRKTVKDCQLVRPSGPGSAAERAPLHAQLPYFTFISSRLLQDGLDQGYPEAVEATWVLALALKGLYRTLMAHSFEEIQAAFLESGLLKLLVKKCSRGTGFSKTWLLRDLEILSVLLYSSKREMSGGTEQEAGAGPPQPGSPPGDVGQSKPDPLEGLDEATKVCFLMTHDALNAPLPILRAMYELQMKRTDSFFLEVQRRFDGDVIATDDRIRALAQKWQPRKRPRLEELSARAVDTDMIVLPCWSRPAACDQAAEESDPVTQKLIAGTESDLRLSYAKQRRAKSAGLLHKELGARAKGAATRAYLHRVNEATAVLYARHVLASLLAQWPEPVPITVDVLELASPAQMAYILDTLMQLEERQLWEKILEKALLGCSHDMLGPVALTACQFMEEPGTAVQVCESKHPYSNNTTFEDKVHIPGAIYLSVKFDPQCSTEEGCDELAVASSSDFQQDRHSFSGSKQKWTDFELPGDTLYYRFTSDMSNTEWGYKFTVTAGHLGRFQTGFEILKKMLSEERVVPHLPLARIWEWQVGVACRQTGHQRLKAIHLLLKIVQCSTPSDLCDLTLLKPLWKLFAQMEKGLCQDVGQSSVLLPLHRALTELFFVTENRVQELGSLQDYLLALTTDDYLLCCTAQALRNIAAISLAINYPNKSTSVWTG